MDTQKLAELKVWCAKLDPVGQWFEKMSVQRVEILKALKEDFEILSSKIVLEFKTPFIQKKLSFDEPVRVKFESDILFLQITTEKEYIHVEIYPKDLHKLNQPVKGLFSIASKYAKKSAFERFRKSEVYESDDFLGWIIKGHFNRFLKIFTEKGNDVIEAVYPLLPKDYTFKQLDLIINRVSNIQV